MRPVLWIARKELLRFVADPSGAVLTVVLPVVLASFMGMVFAAPDGSPPISLGVAQAQDADLGPRTRALVDALEAEPALRVTRLSAQEARAQVGRGDLGVALVLPAEMDAALHPAALFQGRSLDVPLLFDPSRAVERDIARGLVTKAVMIQVTAGFTDQRAMRAMFSELLDELGASPTGAHRASAEGPGAKDEAASHVDPATARLVSFARAGLAVAGEGAGDSAAGSAGTPDSEGESAGLRLPVRLQDEPLSGGEAGVPRFNSYAHNFAGMLSMFLLFLAMQMAQNLVLERREGVLTRVQLAPAWRGAALVGTALATAVISATSAALVYAVGMVAFGIRVEGSWLGFIAVLLALSLFVGAFALLLAGVGRTEKQVSSLGTFAALLISFAGGAMIPSFLMPGWLQSLGHAFPTYWATQGLAGATWRAAPLGDSLVAAGVLLLFAVACAVVGVRAFRWR